MNEKEKAKELIERFMPWSDGVERQEDEDQILEHKYNTKKCALICVEEIIDENQEIDKNNVPDLDTIQKLSERLKFWNKVKQEILDYEL